MRVIKNVDKCVECIMVGKFNFLYLLRLYVYCKFENKIVV